MAQAVTLDKFVAAIELSGLLTPEQFDEVRRLAAVQSDPQIVARDLIRRGWLTRWQAGQLLLGRTTFFMGKYRLLDLLGKGGMGAVFLAEHATMNRRVALKVVGRKLGNDPAAMERFFAEARAIAGLDHPNIVRAYSVDNEDGQFYMVMEFVDGRDLQQIVDTDGPLDYRAAADTIRQAADGLAQAHGRGMVHCDIKPSNLLVSRQGVVKILDMGVARLTGEESAPQPDSPVMGTVDYMAPEQGLGAAHFDHRADIYSLGCTLYFVLTGQPPFPEGTMAQRIVKHQTQQPRSILEKRPDAPRDLVRICRKMMAKEPAERYQTAAEVSSALAQWNPDSRVLKRAEVLDAAPQQPAADSAPPADDVASALAEIAADVAASGPRSGISRGARGMSSSIIRRRQPAKPATSNRTVFLVAIVTVLLVLVALGITIPTLISRLKAQPKPPPATKPAPTSKKPEDETEPWRRYWKGLDQKDDQPAAKPTPPKPPTTDSKPAAAKSPAGETKAAPAKPPAGETKPAAAPAAKPQAGDAKSAAKPPPAKSAAGETKPATPAKAPNP